MLEPGLARTGVDGLRGSDRVVALPDTDAARRASAASPESPREQRTIALYQRLEGCTDEAERLRILDEVVMLNMPVARSIAMRYRDRGENIDDLCQVAYLGLVKAARGFDWRRGHDFLAFAAPTISGEVKRYFRDRGWDIRPPRRIQDLKPELERAADELHHELRRAPTVAEIAARLDVTQEQVIETLVAIRSYSASSLDSPVAQDGLPLSERLGGADDALERVVDHISVAPLVAALPERDRLILSLRFGQNLTQSQIAERIGVSQMQVSRLLARTLQRLRQQVGAGAA